MSDEQLKTPVYDLDAETRPALAGTARSGVYALSIPGAPAVPVEMELDAEWDDLIELPRKAKNNAR